MKRTRSQDEREMLRPFDWDSVLCRFYRRARSGVLHTNVVKHLYDARWGPECRHCGTEVLDTQWHRYGLSQPTCLNTTELERLLEQAYWAIDRELFLPDQAMFPPGIGHYIADHWTLPQRPIWMGAGEYKMIWAPMVQMLLISGVMHNGSWGGRRPQNCR